MAELLKNVDLSGSASSLTGSLEGMKRQAARLIASGYSAMTTAHILGLNADTVRSWSDLPDFQKSVHETTRIGLRRV